MVLAEIENLPIVKMIRSPKQVGIAQSRILGVKLAKGDALVFLDSHCTFTFSLIGYSTFP